MTVCCPETSLQALGMTACQSELSQVSGMTACPTEFSQVSGMLACLTEHSQASGMIACPSEFQKASGMMACLCYVSAGVNDGLAVQLPQASKITACIPEPRQAPTAMVCQSDPQPRMMACSL